MLKDSGEQLRRPPSEDPRAVQEFLRASGEAATLRDSRLDASLVSVPKARDTRDEDKQIKKVKTPDSWDEQPHVKRQKDEDARGPRSTARIITATRIT